MVNALFGIKKGMASSYDARGRRVGATIVEVEPNVVTQLKTADGKDGYNAVQLGLGTLKSVNKPQLGHFKKANVEKNIRWLKEVRVDKVKLDPGQEILASDLFKVGDSVKVTGVSRGRGFQGGVRRYGFAGGPKTHGQSDRHRAPGSIGSGTTPGRVLKGKRMAGHMGADQTSIKNLEVISVSKNLITIKGGIPGHRGGLVKITKLGKIRGYTPPPEEKADEEDQEPKDTAQVENTDGTKTQDEKGVENAS